MRLTYPLTRQGYAFSLHRKEKEYIPTQTYSHLFYCYLSIPRVNYSILLLVSQMNTSIHLIIDNFFTATFVKVFHGITATLLFHGTLNEAKYSAQYYFISAPLVVHHLLIFFHFKLRRRYLSLSDVGVAPTRALLGCSILPKCREQLKNSPSKRV